MSSCSFYLGRGVGTRGPRSVGDNFWACMSARLVRLLGVCARVCSFGRSALLPNFRAFLVGAVGNVWLGPSSLDATLAHISPSRKYSPVTCRARGTLGGQVEQGGACQIEAGVSPSKLQQCPLWGALGVSFSKFARRRTSSNNLRHRTDVCLVGPCWRLSWSLLGSSWSPLTRV